MKHYSTAAILTLAALAMFFGAEGRVAGQGLDVDTSFQAGVFTRSSNLKFLEQPDGKVIVYGNFAFVNGAPAWRIVRFHSDGTVDTGFQVPVDSAFTDVRQIILQPDGRLLVCGGFWRYGGVSVNGLVRLNADGTRDTSFVGPSATGWFQPRAIALQPDGRIVVAGGISSAFAPDWSTYHYGVVRLQANGVLDTTFQAALDSPPELTGVGVQSNGKIIISASAEVSSGSNRRLARLNANGSFDWSFFGYLSHDQVNLQALSVLASDKILLAGWFVDSNGWSPSTGLVMLNGDGSLDFDFSYSAPTFNNTVRSVAFQANGKLVVGGDFTSVGGSQRSRVARLNADYSLDTSFAGPFLSFPTGTASANSVAALANGKILVAGEVTSAGGVPVGAAFRLNVDGTLDSGFSAVIQSPGVANTTAESASGSIFVGGNFTMAGAQNRALIAAFDAAGGVTSFNVTSEFNTNGVNAIVPFADGGLLVGGGFTGMGSRNFLSRLSSTGAISTAFPSLNATVNDLVRQPDGKIVVVGSFTHSNRRSIVRFNADGTLDATFTSPFTVAANVRTVAIQPDGGILIGGDFTTIGSFGRNRVARLTANGDVDQTFLPGSGAAASVFAVRSLPDGRVLVGGQFSSFAGNSSQRFLVRLESTGVLDSTFTAPLNGTVFAVETVGDKILVGGSFTSVAGGSRGFFARLLANGALDGTLTTAVPNGAVNDVSLQADGAVLLAGSFTAVDGVVRPGVARLASLAPVILTPPQSRSVDPGVEVVFTVQAGGAVPLTYQWLKNGTPIGGATEESYVVASAGAADAGSYSVQVTNAYGTATSSAAELSVSVPPTIVQSPGSQPVPRNQSATLTVQASGPGPLSYQWYRGNLGDTSNPVGTNSATFVTPLLGVGTIYWVAVTNAYGTVNAGPAVITVGDPPVITGPNSVGASAGGSASFSVQVSGTEPFFYQWLRNGQVIPGATSATYAVSPVTAENAGGYSVFVSNDFGVATSATATLAINTPPQITTELESQSVVEGTTVTFTVGASGDAPLSYLWYFNNVVIPGETGSSLVLASVTAANAGTYRVTVSNPYGSASSTRSLIVNQPASIAFQPTDRAIAPGTSALLTVSAGGTTPITYQWYRGMAGDTSTPVGSNSASLATPVLDADANFHVVVSNAYGSVTSRTALVRVGVPPTISSHPQSVTRLSGTELSLSVVASGATPLSYQWRKGGVDLPGEAGNTLVRSSVSTGDAGTYDVVVSNIFGSTPSNPAVVVVNAPPVITQPPVGATVLAGEPVQFSVVATGTEPLSYQWSRNLEVLPGETASTLSIGAATSAVAGDYTVTVSNAFGSATSQPAVLVVNGPPTIQTSPQSGNLASGNVTTLTVTATGTGTVSYQWYRGAVGDTSQPVGGNSASFETPALTQTTTYWVRVSNAYGFVNSTAATITVGQAPVITTEPVSQTVSSGVDVQFGVVVSGDGPFTYSWRRGGLVVGTTAMLTLPGVAPSAAGEYYVVVSNAFGSATSLSATLTVQSLPKITSQPQSVTVAEGGTAVFSITAMGNAPLSYQWKRDGQDLPGRTGLSLTISPVQLADAGSYSVVATNSFGSEESQTANLIVQAIPKITQQPANLQVATGSPVTLSVQATGSTPLTYAWYRGVAGDTTNPVGADSAILSLGSIDETSAFWVRVSNAYGSVDSVAATISVGTAPTITTHPVGAAVAVGDTVTLQVAASGTGELFYQWKRGTQDVGTGLVLVLENILPGDAGNYTVVVTNAFGVATSAVATVTVSSRPSISVQPLPQVVPLGGTAVFSVTASGTGPLAYQWFKGEEMIPGETGSALTIAGVTLDSEGNYRVEVSNAVGSALSEPASLRVNAPPSVTQQPGSPTVLTGQGATLQVLVSGSGPIFYQWYRGTPGDTSQPVGNDSFELLTGPLLETTTYWVRASNAFGNADSVAATVTVDDPTPVITSPATAAGTFGSLFVYRILASANPTQFGATGLPDGVSVNPSTGYISGVPTELGEFVVSLSAASATKTGTKTLALTIQPAAPVITSAVSAVGRLGEPFSYQIVATNEPLTFGANNLPAFLSVGTSGLITGTPTSPGQYAFQVRATNAGGVGLRSVALTVLSSSLPPILTGPTILTGQVGSFLTHQLTATNEPATFGAAGLPGGLSLQAGTGIISGAPTTAGTFVVVTTAANANGTSQPREVIFTIAPPEEAPVIQSAIVPRIHEGESVSIPVTAINSPSVFTAIGLPEGLSINSVSGQISGIPMTPGLYPVILRASNSGGTSPDYPVTILVRPPRQTPVIQSAPTVAGRLTVPLAVPLVASNGPLEFRAGHLPGGVTLNPATGVIGGTPTEMGRFVVAVAARNDDGWGGDLPLVITIGAAPTAPVLDPAMSAFGRIGEVFRYQVQATENPTLYSATGLPPGLAIHPELGLIGGTPTEVGIFDVVVTAANDLGESAPGLLRITIQAPLGAPEITSALTARGRLEQAFSYTITASNRATGFSAQGLPPGLTLQGATISGIPTEAGEFDVTLAASNATRGFGTPAILKVTVETGNVRPRITSAAGVVGSQNQTFTYQITAVNGPITGYSAEDLPEGLIFNAVTGVISGVLQDAGPAVFRVNASNAGGSGPGLAVSLTVNPLPSAPVVYSASSLRGYAGDLFSYQIRATGSPTRYRATGLPSWLALNSGTGQISGTLGPAGEYVFRVSAENTAGFGTDYTVTLSVSTLRAASRIDGPVSVEGFVNEILYIKPAYSGLAPGQNYIQAFVDDPAWWHYYHTWDQSNVRWETKPARTGVTGHWTQIYSATQTGDWRRVVVNVKSRQPEMRVTSPALVHVRAGQPLTYQLTAAGTPSSFSFRFPGKNPGGLQFNELSGLLSGTPQVPGTYPALASAFTAIGEEGPSQEITVVVNPAAGTSAITGGSGGSTVQSFSAFRSFSANSLGGGIVGMGGPALAGLSVTGRVGVPFSYLLEASGDVYEFQAEGLPPGLTMNPATGEISGQPSAPGTWEVTLRAINEFGPGADASLTITIRAALGTPVVTSPFAASGVAGTWFSYTIEASESPLGFNAKNLPPWASFDDETGVISGLPDAPGVHQVTVSANNGFGAGEGQLVVLTVAAAEGTPVITSAASASGVENQAFEFQLTATNSPDIFSADSLPGGVVLDSETGRISGVPVVKGRYVVRVWAFNEAGEGAASELVMQIGAGLGTPVMTSPVSASGRVGVPFEFPLAASGDPASFTVGALPPGLTVDGASGLISGVPLEAGEFDVGVFATNGNGSGDAEVLTISISAAAETYADWVARVGLPPEQSGTSATPYGDGVANLVRFALGIDPLSPDLSRLPQMEILTEGGSSYAAILFTRSTDAGGVAYVLEGGTNLSNLDEVPSVLEVLGPVDATSERIRLRQTTPLTNPARWFLRLRVVADE